MKRSDWHNPYFVQKRDVMQACISYADYLFKSNEGKKLLKRLNELENKRLGCWCSDGHIYKPCHAWVIIFAFDLILNRNVNMNIPINRILHLRLGLDKLTKNELSFIYE